MCERVYGSPEFGPPRLARSHDKQGAVCVSGENHCVSDREHRRTIDDYQVEILLQGFENDACLVSGEQFSWIWRDRARSERPQGVMAAYRPQCLFEDCSPSRTLVRPICSSSAKNFPNLGRRRSHETSRTRSPA